MIMRIRGVCIREAGRMLFWKKQCSYAFMTRCLCSSACAVLLFGVFFFWHNDDFRVTSNSGSVHTSVFSVIHKLHLALEVTTTKTSTSTTLLWLLLWFFLACTRANIWFQFFCALWMIHVDGKESAKRFLWAQHNNKRINNPLWHVRLYLRRSECFFFRLAQCGVS